MIEWTKCIDKLPGKRKRCLTYCYIVIGACSWKGFCDMTFDPEIGWFRNERYVQEVNTQISVLCWTDILEEPKYRLEDMI